MALYDELSRALISILQFVAFQHVHRGVVAHEFGGAQITPVIALVDGSLLF